MAAENTTSTTSPAEAHASAPPPPPTKDFYGPVTTTTSAIDTNDANAIEAEQGLHALEASNRKWYAYFLTAHFWLILGLGQVLALCITSTNTFSSLLGEEGTSIPSFQSIFNYILLTIIYTSYFLYREGIRGWWHVLGTDGWKYFIMSFMDVQGNYFTVLAYRYTNILSAQLINFWAIVVVVISSFLLLRVRYKPFQVAGILIACGGMGILIGSDHMTGSNGGAGPDLVKGDLFALLGATMYGLSNTFEEWLASRAPLYQVLSFIGFWGIIIMGVQGAIFDRHQIHHANWNGDVAGYIVGFTLCMTIFYSLVPILLRMASATFFNISLLTANFWGVIIGIHVFKLHVHYLYPIAFVCIIIGLVTYFLTGSMLGESKKPWLGENQERGVDGVGTARRRARLVAQKFRAEPENGIQAS